jgi:hypothetical protein
MGENDTKLLLEIANRTEAALNLHMERDDRRLGRIDEKLEGQSADISELKKDSALSKQRQAWIGGTIALLVSGFVSWVANWFGIRP